MSSRASISTRSPAFSLDTFSSKDFIVKDFIESLSDTVIPTATRRSAPTASGSSTAAFDPKPLIRTFESALARLRGLSEDLEKRENELSNAVRRAEAQHTNAAGSYGQRLEGAVDRYNQLENNLNASASSGLTDSQVTNGNGYGYGNGNRNGSEGRDAVSIGERLEELDKQRQRALDAKFLIQCWQEVSSKGQLSSLEDMRRLGGSEGKVRCASIARQLLRICTRLDQEGISGRITKGNGVRNGLGEADSPAREIIEKFLEMLEKDLLKQFDNHYRKQNFDGMRECAIALRDFNEGASVMAVFVNQHEFFIDKNQLLADENVGDGEGWDKLADPDTEPPGVDPSLQALVDEVKLVVQEESFIMKKAFPFSEEVLTRFLQRVFQQSIQQRLEVVLDKASSISSLAFLRSLQAARGYIGALVDSMKSHGLTEHPEPVTPQIAAVLDQQLDELFVPYFIGSSYIEREKKNLDELYASLLFKYTTYHSRRKKTPTGYLAALSMRSKELVSSARDAYMERLDSTELPPSQKAMLLRIAGIKDSEKDKKSDIEVTEADGELSLAVAKRMIKWLAEAVGRGLELSGAVEVPKDMQALHGLVLLHIGEIYIETALEAAAEQLPATDALKTEPSFSHFPTLPPIISTLHLLRLAITTMLLPLAAPNLTIRRDIEKTLEGTLTALESRMSIILHRSLDVSLLWSSKLLAAQKKNDFRPRDEDLTRQLDALQTPTCASVHAFLTRVATAAAAALDGKNRTVFFSELALGLRSLLFEHLRKFTVSLAGGLIVSKDVNKYAELVRAWPMDADGEFRRDGGMEVLVEVANLFVVGPEALKERLKVGASGAGSGARTLEEVGEMKKYVERREDVGSVAVQAVLHGV
ncbi:exocyst complex component Sec10 [Eremomyces bilateralis CBS 781.70]|uniref:Exocyst complex component Sec10 n=1 Tax=Eremomyces bilateralis CBS 781.70 TaxID=1392243 RepID=A0A6G1FTB6_9PEZI|nr:exocyst complex component Sec10 [Eremomyces bilateralis CBS 781.70]KAF1808932.1 exocyst complex component Sec10 [Eremomyces bilateralis CBS 781.70]